jgi:hypothetical protein
VEVEAVDDALQVGNGRPVEAVLDALRSPPGGGEVERLRDLPAVLDHLAARVGRGPVRPCRLHGDAAVDLAAGVGVEVEAVPVDSAAEGERAGRHGLGAKRCVGPRGGNFAGDDAPHVLIDADRVDHVQRAGGAAGGHDLERTTVGTEPTDQHPTSAGRAQLAPATPQQPSRGGAKLNRGSATMRPVAARRVEPPPAGAAGAAEEDVIRVDSQQDADDPAAPPPSRTHSSRVGRGTERAHRGPPVVVAKDPAVVLAGPGVAVGAVLAHADAVAVAATLDHPGDLRLGGRDRHRKRGDEGEGAGADQMSGSVPHVPSRTASAPQSIGLHGHHEPAHAFL